MAAPVRLFEAEATTLLSTLRGLAGVDLESALRALDADAPPCWDRVVEVLCADVNSRNREYRRNAASILLHVSGGRPGASYPVVCKPRLERPAVWAALVAGCTHADTVLRGELRQALPRCLYHAGPYFPSLIPSILELLDSGARSCALAILGHAGKKGCDLTSAVPHLSTLLPESTVPLVFAALALGDVKGAWDLLEQAPEPSSLVEDVGCRLGSLGEPAARSLLVQSLSHRNPQARIQAVQALGRWTAPDRDLVGRLLDLLADGAGGTPGVGRHAAGALAQLAARDPADLHGAEVGLSNAMTQRKTRMSAAFGLMGVAVLCGRSLQAVALLGSPVPEVRRSALVAVGAYAREAQVPRALALLGSVEELRLREQDESVRRAMDGAVGELVRRLSRAPEAAGPLLALARQRWAEAVELSVYDDERVLAGVLELARGALRAAPRSIPTLVFVAELCLMGGNLRGAAAPVGALLELAQDDPIHQRMKVLLEQGDARAARTWVESERLRRS